MMMRKLVLILPGIEFCDVHLTKDVGLFPEYLAREYGMPAEIVFRHNRESVQKKEWRGMRMTGLANASGCNQPPSIKRPLAFLRFLGIFTRWVRENAGSFSHVMMFHPKFYTILISRYVKRTAPGAKVYVKADSGGFSGHRSEGILWRSLLRTADLVTVENAPFAHEIAERFPKFADKLAYVPNGFDDRHFDPRLFSAEKERLIISVARFGTLPKNSELLLEVLSRCDLKGFRVVLAGPVEGAFQERIESFFARSPHLLKRVRFVGNVASREELYGLYAKASAFLLTSRWENFSLAMLEAAWFGCAVISTDAGCARDMADATGGFVPDKNPFDDAGNAEELARALQRHIDGFTYAYDESRMAAFRRAFSMSEIVKGECFRTFFAAGRES